MIGLFRTRRQRPQENFRQPVELTTLALAESIDDFAQRDAAILHDCLSPLAALPCENERNGAAIGRLTPLDESLSRQLVDQADGGRVRQLEGPAQCIVRASLVKADHIQRCRRRVGFVRVLLQPFVQPLRDLASKRAEQVGSAEFLRHWILGSVDKLIIVEEIYVCNTHIYGWLWRQAQLPAHAAGFCRNARLIQIEWQKVTAPMTDIDSDLMPMSRDELVE